MRVDVLPRGEEAAELGRIDRLGLLAKRRDARPADAAQDVGIAPLPLAAARQQLAANELAGALELAQRSAHVDAVAAGDLGGRKGAVGAGVAADEGEHRVRRLGQEGVRQAAGRRDADRVPVEPRVLGRDPALLAGDAHRRRAPLALELGQHRLGRIALRCALLAFLGGQVAEPAQDLLERVAVLGERVRVTELE